MTEEHPFEARRRSTRRLRTAAAGVAVAVMALVGTATVAAAPDGTTTGSASTSVVQDADGAP